MKTYSVRHTAPQGGYLDWHILGLSESAETIKWNAEFQHEGEERRDETQSVWLVQLHAGEGADTGTPEALALALYSVLYGELQCNENLRDGDRLEVPEEIVTQRYGKPFLCPALSFVCQGIHVLPGDDATRQLLDKAHAKIETQRKEAYGCA